MTYFVCNQNSSTSLLVSDSETSVATPGVRGGLIGYVKSKPLRDGQIISLDVLVFVMIIAVFHKKLV